MKALWIGLVAVGLWCGHLMAAPSPVVLDVYVDAYPPFIREADGVLRGPYVDAFRQLVAAKGIQVRFKLMPAKRQMSVLRQQIGSCGLAMHFSAQGAETLRYVARVAPITLAVYAVDDSIGPLSNIEALRNYRVGAMDVAELNELLDNASIRYQPLTKANNAVAMLQAGRFDLLISDIMPELVVPPSNKSKIRRVMVLARVERWLACNPQLPSEQINALRDALHQGVFADSVADIWQRDGLRSVYDHVRSEWSALP